MVTNRVFALFLSLVLVAAMFTACGAYEDQTSTNNRFVLVHQDEVLLHDNARVYMDTETGVLYLYMQHNSNGGGGISVLYNADGTIMTGK